MKKTSGQSNLATLDNEGRTSEMTEPVPGIKALLGLLMRLLWAAALVLPIFCANAGVVFTSLCSFSGRNGANPDVALVQGRDGSFYGTTRCGGLYTNSSLNGALGNGTVFKVSTNGMLTSLCSFLGGSDGTSPNALVQGSDGSFYGTAYTGANTTQSTLGDIGNGTVFKTSTNGVLTSLYSFTNGIDGGNPDGLLQSSDGSFYGTTEYGGPSGEGTVFKLGTNGALINLCSFIVANGAYPLSGLVQSSNGNFYGTTGYGGTNYSGTVFEISPNDGLTSLYSFTGGIDGANPYAALVQGNDGNFYGTTYGAANGWGTVFKISPNGDLTTLYAFGAVTDGYGQPLDGANPEGALVQGSDGSFYGTTYGGGTNGSGTMFEISTNGTLMSLYAFGSITNASGDALDGANPIGGLVQGGDGSFYGTTYNGGEGGAGTVFRLSVGLGGFRAAPVFQDVTLTGSTLSLTWSTEPGGMYQLQYTSDLSSSIWINLRSSIAATEATLSTTDSVTNGPQRFYRVVLLP